ncbi:FadR/GntR family transcriptional regulator [Agrobacterium pusense]|jgi:GntR family transcriptional regulator, transcriptional repressor for pyruvate dehydrogenase complex|uniref:FadR family transcriptional regulator n=1 Tax=Agrobacterium pusense TaxID=648995 RepID=A0AA44IY45_9HYPH|nr:FadR/GntR family transcriptional regulator [Agrobacterium pusense]NRF07519.1 FadR family transcriptional regulator [Agrobacterium pusense]NRF18251.1 FadR family transcriptional regulator [Agrobacterium pusense]
MFQPVERTHHLPQKVADEIGKKIETGELQPGGKLPAELSLARTFGVSRSVIREAIAKLRSEGLVETRHGIGAFVLSTVRRSKIRLEICGVPDPNDLPGLFQLRLPLERQAARLAATEHKVNDLSILKEHVFEMSRVSDWLAKGIGSDIAFHLAVARATQNRFYVDMLSPLLTYLGDIIPLAFRCTGDTNIATTTFDEHRAVYEAIAARDQDGAEKWMTSHIVNSASRLGLGKDALFGMPLRANKNV